MTFPYQQGMTTVTQAVKQAECVCVVGGSRRSTVRVNVSFSCMLIRPYRGDIPAGCVCVWEVFYVSVAFGALHSLPASNTDPHTEQNSREIPLSCYFTRWTSVIVAEFPPRHWVSLIYTHTHTHTHTYTHPSGVSVLHKQNKKKRNPLFVVMTLFTRWRLGYKNEKCRSIIFGALSRCC